MAFRMPGGTSPAEPLGGDRFRASNGWTFAFSGTGTSRAVEVTDPDGVTRLEYFTPPEASAIQLGDYAGTYESPEVGARYTVAVENNALILRFAHLPAERLTPVYRDGFTGAGRSIRFVRDASGRVIELRIFAGRVRNVKFTRT